MVIYPISQQLVHMIPLSCLVSLFLVFLCHELVFSRLVFIHHIGVKTSIPPGASTDASWSMFMQISKKELLKKANEISKNTLLETLEIEMVDFGDNFLVSPNRPEVAIAQHKLYWVLYWITMVFPKNYLSGVEVHFHVWMSW